MRPYWITACLAALIVGCGDGGDTPDSQSASPAGDAALIAAAQETSDRLGGCASAAGAASESKVVGLESGGIVMLACGKGDYAFTNRLFAIRAGQPPILLTLPDYDAGGWYATDQASMPELDAGSGVLTTYRKAGQDDVCGSEGRYAWDGNRFVLEEMRWRACDSPTRSGPPYPVIWPTPANPAAAPDEPAPAP